MKKILLLLLFPAANLFAQANPETVITPIDGYAARVNNRIITYGDIRESILPFIERAAQHYKGDDLSQQIKQTYMSGRETLIEEALFKEEAKRLGLALSDQVIDEKIDEIIMTRFNNDRALFSQALANRRITYDEWRAEIAEQLTMGAYYRQEVLRPATVSSDAVRKEYEKTKTNYAIPFRVQYRFILINKGTEPQAKRTLAQNTLQKLKTGTDFLSLAQEVSEGDVALSPWRDPDDVREEMRPALRTTAAGQISDLVETDDAFYIIKVEDRQEAGYPSFDELREQIGQELLVKERQRLHQRLVDRLTARHYIERY